VLLSKVLLSEASLAARGLSSFWCELLRSGDAEKRREELQAEWTALVPLLCKSALELSLQRRRAAEGLRQAVEEALKQLAMERSRFHVDVAWVRIHTVVATAVFFPVTLHQSVDVWRQVWRF
jgi:DNA repair ATPase RecN